MMVLEDGMSISCNKYYIMINKIMHIGKHNIENLLKKTTTKNSKHEGPPMSMKVFEIFFRCRATNAIN